MPMSKGERKEYAFTRLEKCLEQYQSVFLVNVDNVSSNQMHQIRLALRGSAEVLMGKNTMARRLLHMKASSHPAFNKLLDCCRGNIGFVFTNGDLAEIRHTIVSNRVQAPARAGAIAPVDVYVPAGSTGMEPGQTSFFQALGIPTKIARGVIEITQEVHLVKVGEKVGASEATLLNKLNISPFTYGLTVENVFDHGVIFSPSVLDITPEDIVAQVTDAISRITCLSLGSGFTTIASVPHILSKTYRDLLSVSIATDYTFEASAAIKELLDNPEALAAAAAAASAATPAAGGAAVAEAAAPEEEEEESDDDMGFGLFD